MIGIKCKTSIIIIFIMIVNICTYSFSDDLNEGQLVIKAFVSKQKDVLASIPVVNAHAAIVMDSNSGRILYSKNAEQRKYIASTTKIMTAIVTLENGNLDDIVTISKRAASIKGSSINLKEGEKLKLKELLYGLMLNSGNDAAIAIAEHIGGDVETFVDMMNKKAKELNLVNTSFKTPHGLDREGHYSTALELAQMAKYALSKPEFASICKTISKSITGRSLYNTNEMLGFYPGADGVKTGYTGQAGRCLVCSATRDGWRLISVVLGCPTRTIRAESSRKILDYSFKNYKLRTLKRVDDEFKRVPVIKGKEKFVAITSSDEIKYPLTDEEFNNLKRVEEIPDSIEAPISEGVNIGNISFSLNGKLIAQSELKTKHEVLRKGFLDYMCEMLKDWLLYMNPSMDSQSGS
ncbi:D-alanyl-D-alanine carboxypeptidase family protein [Pseudobacteroides cellulosolvens]|uniref:serine-type D-Ala-D-Ala carboxypeptidase n=1 Tax=Pseudobacteroides cellulosolvens ATCC 35603 = DSM 2933 TaxID=398512 RepID=A0A0L6JN24_9FIRM|nr:D-alanyl-D-alanine carboxypeptidase family protein [Pseudobacteroides cellulosolvens]KNY26777.1 Serine-type D-Ala-D-Ala carboxypeptidase [Pseudobacteroides cellulosolvens ATCC 35603 = DSM 2933]